MSPVYLPPSHEGFTNHKHREPTWIRYTGDAITYMAGKVIVGQWVSVNVAVSCVHFAPRSLRYILPCEQKRFQQASECSSLGN